jgi:hypothetical protein
VGVEIAANGDVYVADAWNARIQRFDKDLKQLAAFPVPGWLANDPRPPHRAAPGGDMIGDPARQRVANQPDGRIAAAHEVSKEVKLAAPPGGRFGDTSSSRARPQYVRRIPGAIWRRAQGASAAHA